LFPAVSGENSRSSCATTRTRDQCPSTTPYQLVVVNSGVDHKFGTGDDVTTAWPTAATPNIDSCAPSSTRRAPRAAPRVETSSRTRALAEQGHQRDRHRSDGTFSVNDVAVNISTTRDRTAAAFAHSRCTTISAGVQRRLCAALTETTSAGKDGCFTRTADNVVFDTGTAGDGKPGDGCNSNLVLSAIFLARRST